MRIPDARSGCASSIDIDIVIDFVTDNADAGPPRPYSRLAPPLAQFVVNLEPRNLCLYLLVFVEKRILFLDTNFVPVIRITGGKLP